MQKTKGKKKNAGRGRSSSTNKKRRQRRRPERHLPFPRGIWANRLARTSPQSLTPTPVPTGSQEPLGQTAGPPPSSPAWPALIGQSPRAGRRATPTHLGPRDRAGFLKCSEPPGVLPPLLPHHLESWPSGTACSYYNKHLSRNLFLICILAALILMKYANVCKMKFIS